MTGFFLSWRTSRCPQCNTRLQAKFYPDDSLHLGAETAGCPRCGARLKTGNLEWIHLSRQQKVLYFVSDVGAAFVIFPLLGLVGQEAVIYPKFGWYGFLVGVVLAGVCAVLVSISKLLAVWLSVKRVGARRASAI